MSDALLETFLHYGTNAQRLAFTPDPPIVSGVAVKVLYEWRETDTGDVYVYDTSWHLISSGTATAVTSLTGDVTGTGPGATATTIANNAVTLAKIAHAAANSKLLGSGSAGSGANYSELALGSGLTMTGTTLSAAGSGGTVTNTGTLTSGKTIIGNGTVDVTVSSLTANLLASSSGTIAGAVAAANDKLLGSGNSGSAAAYAEITLGSGLTMTGTTLSASGSGGSVTTTGSPASGNLSKFSGATSITNADLTGDVTTSGTVATTIANSAVTLAKIANASASSKLVGSGASGSGAAYTEITLGTNLSMSGTTINAAAGSSGAWTQLSQIVTSGSQATVDFTSIAGGYNALVLRYVSQDTASGNSSSIIRIRFNNDSTSGNYTSSQFIGAQGGSLFTSAFASAAGGMMIGVQPNASNTSVVAQGEISIEGYAGTTWHKRMIALCGADDGATGGWTSTANGRWKSTAAVTRLTVTTDGTAFANGSIFTLYGIL